MAVLVAALAALLAPALASAGWSAGQSVSGVGTNTSQTRIAGGSDGTSIVVWKRDVAGFDVIQGTRVAIDGTSGPTFNISPLLQSSTDPVVVSGADGNAVVGWTNTSGTNDVVQTATVAVDGTVGTVQTRSAAGPAGQDAIALQIAIGGDGSYGLTWRRYNGTYWLVQGMRVAADGTAGPVLDLSETDSSAGDPAVAASADTTPSYFFGWVQDSTHVISREISSDGTTLTEPSIVAVEGGNPHDVRVGVGNEGSRTIAWIRERAVTDGETTCSSQTVEATHPPSTFAEALTPTVCSPTYDADQLAMVTPAGSQPALAWRHDLPGGTYRVETGRFLYGGVTVGLRFYGWAGQSPTSSDIETPIITASKNAIGIVGWAQPAASNAAWSRFSNTSVNQYTETGYDDVTDPGFVQAESGYSLAAYTATVGGVSTSRVALFTDPGFAVDPSQHNFGQINIGTSAASTVVIRSNGQTPGDVTGVDLSGADTSEFSLDGQAQCVGSRAAGTNCSFRTRFSPLSAGSKSATVTVHTSQGDFAIPLSGVGGTGTRLSLKSTPRKKAVRRGKVVRIRVTAANIGGVDAGNAKICPTLNRRVLRLGKRCVKLGTLAVGGQRVVTFPVRVTGKAKRGKLYPVTFRLRAGNAVERLTVSRVKRKGR